jgi:hypothetical protein
VNPPRSTQTTRSSMTYVFVRVGPVP